MMIFESVWISVGEGFERKSVKGGTTNIVVMNEAMLAKRYVVGWNVLLHSTR